MKDCRPHAQVDPWPHPPEWNTDHCCPAPSLGSGRRSTPRPLSPAESVETTYTQTSNGGKISPPPIPSLPLQNQALKASHTQTTSRPGGQHLDVAYARARLRACAKLILHLRVSWYTKVFKRPETYNSGIHIQKYKQNVKFQRYPLPPLCHTLPRTLHLSIGVQYRQQTTAHHHQHSKCHLAISSCCMNTRALTACSRWRSA